jgi:hypothetical protein
LPPGDDLVEFALRVARGSTAERVSFHAGYHSIAADPGVDHVEVITELRRLVLLAEIRASVAHGWRDAREAADALAPYRGRLTVEAHVRFAPQRGYTSVPRLEVRLGHGSLTQPALDVHIEPIEAPGPLPLGGQRLVVGAVIEATFAAPAAPGICTLVIHVDEADQLLTTIDLTGMP